MQASWLGLAQFSDHWEPASRLQAEINALLIDIVIMVFVA
jgi:hypothetical protein